MQEHLSDLPGSNENANDIKFDNASRLIKNGWLQTYIKYTESQESPTQFHVWTGLTVLAGILKRNVYLGRGYYKLYPNLYTLLIAPSGRCRKSTASSVGVSFFSEIDGINLVNEKTTPEGLVEQMIKNSFKPDYSLIQRSDNGQKILPKEMKFSTECSAFIYASELAVFLGKQTYNTGLTELLTALYEGKDIWHFTTKGGGKVPLENINLNILGCSNPEWLSAISEDAFGGGFIGRIICVYQDRSRLKIAFPELTIEQKAMKAMLINDLFRISALKGEFTFEPEAHEFFKNWYETFEPDYGGRLAGFLERKPEHILKVAMLLSVSFEDSLKIRLPYIYAAKSLLDEVEKSLPKAFVYVGATNEAKMQQRVVELLENPEPMPIKTLFAKMRQQIRSRREFYEVLDTLESIELIKGFEQDGVKFYTNYSNYLRLVEEATNGKEKEDPSGIVIQQEEVQNSEEV